MLLDPSLFLLQAERTEVNSTDQLSHVVVNLHHSQVEVTASNAAGESEGTTDIIGRNLSVCVYTVCMCVNEEDAIASIGRPNESDSIQHDVLRFMECIDLNRCSVTLYKLITKGRKYIHLLLKVT